MHPTPLFNLFHISHEGIDIKDIQEWVGHKDIQTTLNIYAQVNQKEKDKVNQKMSKLLLEM